MDQVADGADKQSEQLTAAGRLLGVGEVDNAVAILIGILKLNPNHVDALNWLAAVRGIEGRTQAALALIERATTLAPNNAGVLINRGNILLDLGDFDGAITAYRDAVHCNPKAYEAMNNLGALLYAYGLKDDAEQLLRVVVENEPEFGLAQYNLSNVLGAQGRFQEAVKHAFLAVEHTPKGAVSIGVLAAAYLRNGDRDGALAVVHKWLGARPNDPEAAHLIKVIEGIDIPPRASDGYIESLFDRFSSSFDSKLATLEYRAPELIGGVLEEFGGPRERALRVLDLGCGTGLCGPYARDFARHLCGVDLSAGMLQRAARTEFYDQLVKAELTEFLGAVKEPYDIALSADTLCYFGVLEAFAVGAANALKPGGLLTFTVEALPEDDEKPYRLEISSRYKHARVYVVAVLEAAGFDIVRVSSEKLRMEFGEPVAGHLVVARRR